MTIAHRRISDLILTAPLDSHLGVLTQGGAWIRGNVGEFDHDCGCVLIHTFSSPDIDKRVRGITEVIIAEIVAVEV